MGQIIKRATVRTAADIAAAQNNQRTKPVKCKGAIKVVWRLVATNVNALAAVNLFVSQDPTFDAASGNFRAAAATEGVTIGSSSAAGALNSGGRIVELWHEFVGGIGMGCEQAELRFNSHASLSITGLAITADVIYPDGGAGEVLLDSGIIN